MATSLRVTPSAPATRAGAQSRARSVVVKAAPARRDLLLGAGAAAAAALNLAAPAGPAQAVSIKLNEIPVEGQSPRQLQEQQAAYLQNAIAVMREYVDASDAPGTFRLVFNDAGTYDPVTKTGGMNGSVTSDEEMSRPENRDLKAVLAKLAKGKAAIDASPLGQSAGPISWADTLVVGAKVATDKAWDDVRVEKTGGDLAKAGTLKGFSKPFVVRIGREDNLTPGPAGVLPAPGASPEDISAFLNAFNNPDPAGTKGNGGNPFAKQAPWGGLRGFIAWTSGAADPFAEEDRIAPAEKFWQSIQVDLVRSRKTTTRTTYEVAYMEAFDDLARLGANFNPKKYCQALKPAQSELKL